MNQATVGAKFLKINVIATAEFLRIDGQNFLPHKNFFFVYSYLFDEIQL